MLEVIRRSNEISIYRLLDPYSVTLERYIASTPESRLIINNPEITGSSFRKYLRSAIVKVLQEFPDKNIRGISDREACVLVFLRGGLSFDLTGALAEAWNFENHTTSFMTSQRAKDDEGRWFITDFQYQKFAIPKNATVFCGDIVATGTTVTAGLWRMFKFAKNTGRPVRNLVFFTVGCHKIEKTLDELDREMRSAFRGYGKTYVFYLEGKFHLADSKTLVEIKEQGTDLLRYPAILAPEFELSQYEKVSSVLERCVIYDGGSRSFDPEYYLLEVSRYWEEVLRLADSGWTLRRAMKERWPEVEYEKGRDEFVREKLEKWKGIEKEFPLKIYQACEARWSGEFSRYSDSPDALREIAEKRLHELTPRGKRIE